jgi:hypothetical protein
MAEGLIPSHGWGLTSRRQKHSCVWLTDNPEYILQNQAGVGWISIHYPVILEIDISDLLVQKYAQFEFFVDGNIPNKHIVSAKNVSGVV